MKTRTKISNFKIKTDSISRKFPKIFKKLEKEVYLIQNV